MKKLIIIALIMVLTLSLAACGGNDKPSSSNSPSTPSTSQGGNSTTPPPSSAPNNTPSENENTGGGLFDIADSEITVEDGGDLAALPDYLKKGIGGRLGYATLNDYSFLVTTYDVKKEQMRDLRDYYAENCEGIEEVNDNLIDDMGMFEIVCDWGQINAVMNASETGGTTVTAMFN